MVLKRISFVSKWISSKSVFGGVLINKLTALIIYSLRIYVDVKEKFKHFDFEQSVFVRRKRI